MSSPTDGRTIDAATLKAWLSDGKEIALLDVQENGPFAEGHAFFAIPLPYSRLEIDLPRIVPNRSVRTVLMDGGDGIAGMAAKRAAALGYGNVQVLGGGVPAWGKAGNSIYKGVNVPSKTFGELVELERHTPRITADDLVAMQKRGDNMVIVDGRTPAEYRRFNIPGGILCPNGELALRIGEIVKDPTTTIVVNCAGRTRSIIGAQTLIDLGVPNKVVALENGTQGWFLAGYEVEKGASRLYPEIAPAKDLAAERARAIGMAKRFAVPTVSSAVAATWLSDGARTTYVLDVRTAEEFKAGSLAGAVHAPGGQLIQATDQWVGVKGGRIVLIDSDGVRAPVVASWLRQLGHDAYVLDGGVGASLKVPTQAAQAPTVGPTIEPGAARDHVKAGQAVLLDLRASTAYRDAHAEGAVWSIRPRIAAAAGGKAAILIADEPGIAEAATLDLREAGCTDVSLMKGGHAGWAAAGLPVTKGDAGLTDADCIDFVYFTHGRHDGDENAARGYLSWEINLINQLDAQERGAFRIG